MNKQRQVFTAQYKTLSIITKLRGTVNNQRMKSTGSDLKEATNTVQNKGTINRIGAQKNVGNLSGKM